MARARKGSVIELDRHVSEAERVARENRRVVERVDAVADTLRQ